MHLQAHRRRKFGDHGEGWISQLALDSRDVGPIKAGRVCQSLLGKARPLSGETKIPREELLNVIHAGTTARCRR